MTKPTGRALTEPKRVCPECAVGKHRNCVHGAWDYELDVEVPCECGPDCVSFDPLGVT